MPSRKAPETVWMFRMAASRLLARCTAIRRVSSLAAGLEQCECGLERHVVRHSKLPRPVMLDESVGPLTLALPKPVLFPVS